MNVYKGKHGGKASATLVEILWHRTSLAVMTCSCGRARIVFPFRSPVEYLEVLSLDALDPDELRCARYLSFGEADVL